MAEILESDEDGDEPEPLPEEEILSAILEPEDAGDEDPEDAELAADALRASLSAFRPMLRRMTPRQRQRFNADVAARMKKLSRRQAASGKPNPYAAIRKSAGRDTDARTLGQKIMASRNVNIRK